MRARASGTARGSTELPASGDDAGGLVSASSLNRFAEHCAALAADMNRIDGLFPQWHCTVTEPPTGLQAEAV